MHTLDFQKAMLLYVINKEKNTRFSLNLRVKNLYSPYNDIFGNEKKLGSFYIPYNLKGMTLFNLKNFSRIIDEKQIVNNNNFPYFYSPKQKFTSNDIGGNIKIYIPIDDLGCWVIKTPCIYNADHVAGSQLGPFKVIKKKY